MPDIHLKYGGSTARRTINCPAWHNLAKKAPQVNRTSAAADRGTFLHGLMEGIYNDEFSLETALERAGDDADAIQAAYDMTEDFLDTLGEVDLVNEAFVQVPDTAIGGSADMIIASDKVVAILDYKFGYQPVEHREQFLLYAYAGEMSRDHADLFADDRDLVSVIVQPAQSREPLTAEHSMAERDDFIDKLDAAVKLAESGHAVGNPGDWCQYCPAAAYCPAKKDQARGFLSLDPKVTEELAEAMDLVAEMKEHIKAVEAELFSVLEAGGDVEGWKLVLKETRRYWRDEEKVLHMLRYNKHAKKNMYLEEKLRSVAQVEKELKKAKVDIDLTPHIDKRSSGTTIAPASDKRPAVNEVKEMPAALANLYE